METRQATGEQMTSRIKVINSNPDALLQFYLNFDKTLNEEERAPIDVMTSRWFSAIVKQSDTLFERNATNLTLIDDVILKPIDKQDISAPLNEEDYFNYLVYVTTLRRKIQHQLGLPESDDGRFSPTPLLNVLEKSPSML